MSGGEPSSSNVNAWTGTINKVGKRYSTDVYLKLVEKHVTSLGISLMIQNVYVCVCV